MRSGVKRKFFSILPKLAGGIVGLLAPWMILGYWTRWLFFPEIQKYLFLLIISSLSCAIFALIFLLIWKRIYPGKLNLKNFILLLFVFGLSLFTSIFFRAELPFSLSNPFKVYEINITRIPTEHLPGQTQNRLTFGFYSAYGNPVYMPSLEWNEGWNSSGNKIFSVSDDALPLQYRFPENRVNSRFSLLLFKTPDSGQAVLKVDDQTIPLNFFASENTTETIKFNIAGVKSPSKAFLFIEFLLQVLLFTLDFSRRIIQIEPTPEKIELNTLKNDGIEYLLIEKQVLDDGIVLPSALRQISNPNRDQVLFAVPQ